MYEFFSKTNILFLCFVKNKTVIFGNKSIY